MHFVQKSRKILNFEPTFDYIMLCNFGTVRLIFTKKCQKLRKTLKKKSWNVHKIIVRNVEGGGGWILPLSPPYKA